MIDTVDWDKAIKRLEQANRMYTVIGTAGSFVMSFIIVPCQERIAKGERTQDLYDEILDIEL